MDIFHKNHNHFMPENTFMVSWVETFCSVLQLRFFLFWVITFDKSQHLKDLKSINDTQHQNADRKSFRLNNDDTITAKGIPVCLCKWWSDKLYLSTRPVLSVCMENWNSFPAVQFSLVFSGAKHCCSSFPHTSLFTQHLLSKREYSMIPLHAGVE